MNYPTNEMLIATLSNGFQGGEPIPESGFFFTDRRLYRQKVYRQPQRGITSQQREVYPLSQITGWKVGSEVSTIKRNVGIVLAVIGVILIGVSFAAGSRYGPDGGLIVAGFLLAIVGLVLIITGKTSYYGFTIFSGTRHITPNHSYKDIQAELFIILLAACMDGRSQGKTGKELVTYVKEKCFYSIVLFQEWMENTAK